MKISGIYKITNTVTGDFYIGSSVNVKIRWTAHKAPSTWKAHPSIKLYQDILEYGLSSFTFEILEETENLIEREQYWIEQLKPSYNDRRATGRNIERQKGRSKQYMKEWYVTHRADQLSVHKDYRSRLCYYNGETLTLGALAQRFIRKGIPRATSEAKKYLILA